MLLHPPPPVTYFFLIIVNYQPLSLFKQILVVGVSGVKQGSFTNCH